MVAEEAPVTAFRPFSGKEQFFCGFSSPLTREFMRPDGPHRPPRFQTPPDGGPSDPSARLSLCLKVLPWELVPSPGPLPGNANGSLLGGCRPPRPAPPA
jgi:hypothetical protein